MAKVIDNIMMRIIVFFILFIWTYFIVRNIWWTILITLFLYILIWLIVKIVRKKKGGTYTSDRLETHFAIMGNDYVIELVEALLADDNYTKKNNNTLILSNDKSIEMIVSKYKFSTIGYEDIASIYRQASNEKVKRVYVLSKGIDRSAIILSQGLNIKFIFVKTSTLYKYLQESDNLPDLVEYDAKPMAKVSIALMIQELFNKRNTKFYLFGGVLLGLMSFITPLSGYYVSISTISFVLAALTIMPFTNSIGKEKIIDEAGAENAAIKTVNDTGFTSKLKKVEKKIVINDDENDSNKSKKDTNSKDDKETDRNSKDNKTKDNEDKDDKGTDRNSKDNNTKDYKDTKKSKDNGITKISRELELEGENKTKTIKSTKTIDTVKTNSKDDDIEKKKSSTAHRENEKEINNNSNHSKDKDKPTSSSR